MPNTNCLEGMKCPKCGNEYEGFYIVVECLATVTDDGIADTESFDWDDKSYCRCCDCEHAGEVAEFKIINQKGESHAETKESA